MRINKKTFVSSVAGVLASSLLAVSVTAGADDTSPGYVEDSRGNIVTSGSGDCVHTGYWKSEMANIVGCDGVTLDAPVEVIQGMPTGLVGAIVIPEAALFAFDSADLTDEGKTAIEEYRKELRPEIAEAYAGIIIGHTDSTGPEEYNEQLSLRRATSVKNYLVDQGVEPGIIDVSGKGETMPIADNGTRAGRAQNRRVEINVGADVQQ